MTASDRQAEISSWVKSSCDKRIVPRWIGDSKSEEEMMPDSQEYVSSLRGRSAPDTYLGNSDLERRCQSFPRMQQQKRETSQVPQIASRSETAHAGISHIGYSPKLKAVPARPGQQQV